MNVNETLKLVGEIVEEKKREISNIAHEEIQEAENNIKSQATKKVQSAFDSYRKARSNLIEVIGKNNGSCGYELERESNKNASSYFSIKDSYWREIREKIQAPYSKKLKNLQDAYTRVRGAILMRSAEGETILKDFLEVIKKM